MPRIPNSLLREAHALDIFLPPLLAPCRDLHTARNELRWLREHVKWVAKTRRARGDTLAEGSLLRRLVKERASGKPLQYILGTEYFGDLEIRCRPGVLIPRQDTAASITHLARLLRDTTKLPPELRLLDLCTGTGCIPLLFQHELHSARDDVVVRALGVDVSEGALHLAHHNVQRLYKNSGSLAKGRVQLIKADVLVDPFADQVAGPMPLKTALNYKRLPSFWDILTSNPPYISPSEYWKTTTRSVRGYEPKLALVPPPKGEQDDIQQGDMFYPRLLNIARDVEAKIVLLEIADMAQALRVAQRALQLGIFDGIEIWREDPSAHPSAVTDQNDFHIRGDGNARSVICWRGLGAVWLGKVDTVVEQDDARRLFQSHGSGLLPLNSRSESTFPPAPQFLTLPRGRDGRRRKYR
ncbi:S-adenosyl-L-methionine-dependent methyltransferase [Paraphoma chrysanthemicola]|uniref:S-adenosyl-L-methionine-dependent methyltransferase n=1 Tax=Paraphoma chrysanthemicola TaxID=798071 RepID=A0A8K0R8V1_9PLEO|nr:S-adenosyl-L-methionine-dependent methyltransferase [Paraphoma chrysanthemicola]